MSNHILANHEPDAYNPPKDVSNPTAIDHSIEFLFEGFRRWDAIHFLKISEHGYTAENQLAFFPLYPIILRSLDFILLSWWFPAAIWNRLLIVALSVNFAIFTSSAIIFYRLSKKVIVSDDMSRNATSFYVRNPASVFFIAPYTECLFALFSFSGFVRSNSIINIGFVIYAFIQTVYSERFSFQCFIKTIVLSIIGVLPYALFQLYGFKNFCFVAGASLHKIPSSLRDYNDKSKLEMAPLNSTWCSSLVPSSYGYIQSHYWNVGFMKYYTLKQIPNFLLATPILVLCCYAISSYYLKRRYHCHHIGLDRVHPTEEPFTKYANSFYCDDLFVYIIHCIGLVAIATLFMHIQVATRFICSSSPVIYWYIASLRNQLYISRYFTLYVLVGVIAFSKSLPWT